jgi:hypothetical protein
MAMNKKSTFDPSEICPRQWQAAKILLRRSSFHLTSASENSEP